MYNIAHIGTLFQGLMPELLLTTLKVILGILALFGGKELINKTILRYSKKQQNFYKSNSLGEAIGRDKVTNNYFFSTPNVGNPEDLFNRELNSERMNEKIINFYEIGFAKLNIEEQEIKKVTNLIYKISQIRLNGLRQSKFPEKGSTNDHDRHIRGAIFAFGTENFNEEWKEHAASSLREMLSLFSGAEDDFGNALKDLSKEGLLTDADFSNIKSACIKIKKYYQYFTGITHHEPPAIINGYRQLVDYSAQSNICLSSDSFKRVFCDFFVNIKKIIENVNI